MALKESLSIYSRLITKIKSFGATTNPVPPYEFMCQVGDPVLRVRAEPVDPPKITSPEIRKVIHTMRQVMRGTYSVGISAPQIGCPLQITMMEFSNSNMRMAKKEEMTARLYQAFPLKVFINPTMEVINNQQLVFPEGCESIRGYSADVPRYYEVKISGLNEHGEHHEWQARGWPARIIQHEIDHLEGCLYIDRMNSRSFQFNYWQYIKKLPKSRKLF